MALDSFWLFFINVCKRVASVRLRMQQFVELGMDGLSIPVLGALNE